MNILPINAEWKRRQKWAHKQKKQDKTIGQANKQTANCKNSAREEIKHVQEGNC